MSRFRLWLVGIVAASVFFLMPLAFLTATAEQHPEIRITYGEGRTDPFSALIVTDTARVLLINSDDRRKARSTIGTLFRPWEPPYSVVIAPAGDATFAGVHEATRNPGVRQVIIAGLPGANPEWTALERELAARDVVLHYTGNPVEITQVPLQLSVYPGTHIVVRNGQALVVLAMGTNVPANPAHLAILNQPRETGDSVDLVMVPISDTGFDGSVIVERGRRSTVMVHEHRIEIDGWDHLMLELDAN